MTFDKYGNPIFSDEVSDDYLDMHSNNKLDNEIMIAERINYLKRHNLKYYEKFTKTKAYDSE